MNEIKVIAHRISEIDHNKYDISDKNNKRNIPVFYNGNEGIVFQTPYLSVLDVRKSNDGRYYQINLGFEGETEKKINMWHDFLQKTEDHIIDLIRTKGSKYFPNKNAEFKTFIRDKEFGDKEYTKWVLDSYAVSIEDNIDINEITKNVCLKLLVEIKGLWIHDTTVGLAPIIRKIRVKNINKKEKDNNTEFNFANSESSFSDDNEEHEKIVSFMMSERPVVENSNRILDNEDFSISSDDN
jgi:hypothetical protein